MQLKEFSLISPVIESGAVLKALETAIPKDVIEQAISDTEVREERQRSLPSHLVVCLIIAMSLWSSATISNSPQKSGRWLERSLGENGKVLASTLQILNKRALDSESGVR